MIHNNNNNNNNNNNSNNNLAHVSQAVKELNGEECHHLRKNAKIRHIEYTNIARSFKILAQTKRIVAEVFSFLLFSSEKFDYCMIFFHRSYAK